MRIMVIRIVVGALGTIPKGLERGLEQLEEESRPSWPQHCWDWPGYYEDSGRSEETCSHSASTERATS